VIALIINNNNDDDDINNIVMSDDGRGRDITIPGVLISKADGMKLAEFYIQNKNKRRIIESIVLEVDIEMEHSSNTVKYDNYMTSDNEDVYNLLIDFYFYHKALKDQAILNVHYITYSSPKYRPDYRNAIPNCYGSGKYCNSLGSLTRMMGD
jgi:hypothetical protein